MSTSALLFRPPQRKEELALNYQKRPLLLKLSIKNRILTLFIGPMLLFIVLSVVSYSAISAILNNKLQLNIQDNLNQFQNYLDNSLTDLNYVSQQLVEGSAGEDVVTYFSAEKPYNKSMAVNDVKRQIDIISFTHPQLSLISYYFRSSHSPLFESSTIAGQFRPESFRPLAVNYLLTYSCPHPSYDRYNPSLVISLLRKIITADANDEYVYIESNFSVSKNLLSTANSFYSILDKKGDIVYSQKPAVLPLNVNYFSYQRESQKVTANYYAYVKKSNFGYSVVSMVPARDYNIEKYRWFIQVSFIFVIFILFSILSSLFMWRALYRPLNKFDQEIKLIQKGNFTKALTTTNIPEYDYLLTSLSEMKYDILDLLEKEKDNEKKRSQMEIEKLLYQINPHFLMNTLNTLHWMAVDQKQKNIDSIVISLNKLLYYNLKQGSLLATVRDELNAVTQYMNLQQKRFEFRYDIAVSADENVMELQVPRFILQPIVENAIYHGLRETGSIQILIKKTDSLEIVVCDNGSGIPEQELAKLVSRDFTIKNGELGIGISYVKRIIESIYEGKAELKIFSSPDTGTRVQLKLPLQEATHDQSIDSGR
jgi:Putative regulator of cell autolysis